MTKRVRARYTRGLLKPLEDLDLEEGEEVTLTIEEAAKAESMLQALRATAGGWVSLLDLEEFERQVYASRLVQTRPEPRL